MNLLKTYLAFPTQPETTVKQNCDPTYHIERETRLEIPVSKLEELRKNGTISIIRGEYLQQYWFANDDKNRYRGRLRSVYTARQPDNFEALMALDSKVLAQYYHTIKHRITDTKMLEISSPLTAPQYVSLLNQYLDKDPKARQEIVTKSRYYLLCEGMDNSKIVVTADIYSRNVQGEDVLATVEFEAKDDSVARFALPNYFFS